jgi:hypothetical protein
MMPTRFARRPASRAALALAATIALTLAVAACRDEEGEARKQLVGSYESPPDSGTFRIQGVTLVLRSLAYPGGVPYRFTISGDTLFNANATQVQAVTGYDIGEEKYTRVR